MNKTGRKKNVLNLLTMVKSVIVLRNIDLDLDTFIIGGFMSDYYKDEDLDRFVEIGKHSPELFKKFMNWYTSALLPGVLSKREKVLIGVAVAHAIQCPYCIDAYTKSCLEEGMDLEHITEALHVASAVRGGASLIHGIQAHNAADKISM